MQIDFDQPITDLDGSPIPDASGLTIEQAQARHEAGDLPILTLRKASVSALSFDFPDERELAAATKVERYDLALRTHRSTGLMDISPEELTLVRRLVAKRFGVVVTGSAMKLLDAPKPADAAS